MKNISHLVLFILSIIVISCAKEETSYRITTAVSPASAGVVSPSSMEVSEGSSVSFTATPNDDYVFTGWSGSISGTDNPLTVTITSDMNVTANFALRSYPLTLSTEGEGQIIEKVISTRTDYTSGTVVELSAQASEHWQFSHWEGDITGSENPAQITVSSAKSVKAIFTKKSYEYSLKIVGPGAVDEEIVKSTRATLEAGTILRLSAYPDVRTNAVFKGWSGDFTGTDPVIEVNIDDVKNITATFGKAPARKYELPDLKQPWVVLKNLYHGLDFSKLAYDAGNMVAVDYNMDGYIDVVTAEKTVYTEGDTSNECDIRFFLGNPDGTFSTDPINDMKIIGEHARKMIYGDYNGDNKPDICIIPHGYDAPPFPGSFPVFLMSTNGDRYEKVEFRNNIGYYHGGTSGDFDNDGDVDVVYIDSFNRTSAIYINDGKGNFSYDHSLLGNTDGIFTCELFDVDNDGFLDLIWGGNSEYRQCGILWGNGESFNHTDFTPFPKALAGCELHLDFEFCDLNNDGTIEIVINSTSNGKVYPTYDNWGMTVVECKDRVCKDVTFQYFEEGKNMGFDRIYTSYTSIVWIDMEVIDGKTYLTGRNGTNGDIYYEFVNGKFVRDNNTTTNVNKLIINNGIVLYSDYLKTEQDYMDGCSTENPFMGDACIKFSKWSLWNGFEIKLHPSMDNGTDLSYLTSNDYVLEFYIKNNDPTLIMDIKFESIINQNMATYCYSYSAENNYSDEWQKVTIPLRSFDGWDNIDNSFWSKIHHLQINICNDGGKDFYLDEIRIRKAL
ncbi:MAG: VCBS repeat-containing protein [Tidjanibacter sp.]|nr:VCBS repeat-containing protein [Tidjanibacter sp.]